MKTKISKSSTAEEIAAIVSESLNAAGIEAVLSGGSVVSIYADNEYVSRDLDFVTAEGIKEIAPIMTELGFERTSGRHFTHPKSEFYVEFPSAPLAIGNEPVKSWAQRRTKAGTIQLLTPTQCVMDRLAGYYFWKDHQNLDQAVMVAVHQPIDIKKIKAWSKREGFLEQFELFVTAIKDRKNT